MPGKRPDGSFGFDEFRRDHEDTRGWYPIGFHSDEIFETFEDAKQAARQRVAWLRGVL